MRLPASPRTVPTPLGSAPRSTVSAQWRRLLAAMITVVLAAGLVLAGPGPAYADPDGDTSLDALKAKLDVAAAAYNDAKGRLDTARAKQAEISAQQQATATELTSLTAQVQVIAGTMYATGRLSALNMMLDAGSADDFLSRATMLSAQTELDNAKLGELTTTRARYDKLATEMAQQVAVETNQLALMDKQKKAAEKALADAKGGASDNGPGASGSASATAAARNSDGSWPAEKCSQDDPTTSGCLTPRTLHAYQEVKKAGFTHYVSCHRSGGSGEHPKGRACDWSANASTFVDARATGDDKAYGDRLASWFLTNADRLGILYVIWYKRIWMASTGWRSYGGDGTPAGDHYNHVHMSIQ